MILKAIFDTAREKMAPTINAGLNILNSASANAFEPLINNVRTTLTGEISGVRTSLFDEWATSARLQASSGVVLKDRLGALEAETLESVHETMLRNADNLALEQGLSRHEGQRALLDQLKATASRPRIGAPS